MKPLKLALFLLLLPLAAKAQNLAHFQEFCQVGGQSVSTSGLNSRTHVQRSFPNCSITVYLQGTTTKATIFSDNLATPTPLANPYTANNNGSFLFYTAAACYDIVTSGGNAGDTFPTPYTYYDTCLTRGGGGGGGGGSGSVTSVGLAAPTGITVSGSPVTSTGTLSWAMPTGWTLGSLLLGNGTNSVTNLPIGASGTVLVSDGSTASWGGPFNPLCAGTTNQVIKFLNGTTGTCGDSTGFDDGTNPAAWSNGLSIVGSAVFKSVVNAGAGTTQNQLVEFNSSGQAINATSASTATIGIAGPGAGASGSVTVAFGGVYGCVFDGQTVINHYVIPSSSTAGYCNDAGATRPSGAEIIGRVKTLNSGAATVANVDLFTGDTVAQGSGASGVVAPCSTTGSIAYYPGSGSTVNCDPDFTTDGAGNTTGISHTTAGTGAGFLFQTQGTQPTFGVANSIYLFAPTSIASTFALKWPAALGTAGQALVLTGVSGSVGTLGFSTTGTTEDHTCVILIGSDNGAALANADIAPQTEYCQVSAASTVYEIDVTANAGTPTTILAKRHCTASACAANFTVTDLVSGTLTTAASGGPACSKVGATAGLDTFTTCAATLQNTALAAGDYLETRTATAGGVATRMTISIHYTTP